MSIKIGTLVSRNNGGDGVRIEGDVDFEVDSLETSGNGGQGINVIKHAGIMQQFGLPKETDPKELAALLLALRNSVPEKQTAVVKESSLFSKFAIGALNTTTLISNLINIASSPQGLQLIATLMK